MKPTSAFSVLLISLLICLQSCKSEQPDSLSIMSHVTVSGNEIPVFDLGLLPDSAERIPLSEVFSKVDLVPLETSKECYIKNVMPGFTGHSYLIATQTDGLGPVRVLEFGLDGKFIREIGRGGKGPGEHQGYMAMNMRYYPEDSLLFIPFLAVSPTENQLFTSKGAYVGYVNNPIDLTDGIERLNDSVWMIPCNITGIPEMKRDSLMLVLFDRQGKILKSFPREVYPRKVLSGYFANGWSPSMLKTDSEWHFYNPGNDTLFQITPDKLIPLAVFHLGSKGETYNDPVDGSKIPGRYGIRIIAETGRHFLLNKVLVTKADLKEYKPGQWGGMFTVDQSFILIDKTTGKARHIKFTDDFTGIIPEFRLNYYAEFPENLQFIMVPQALDLLDWLKKPQIAEPNQEVRERQDFLRKDLTEMSNPVVFHYIFKRDF
ncbi:MAG: hypothetical protein A2X22_06510 [Bacteroidetes bacterium GWF2_49_14]|nr:MAG: hypothetical protein A2X22_06510 [Bacteroidetes bacterium GWF2_49_14]